MYGKATAVKDVSLRFPANRVHALIGPSGCGKSTFLRTLNRMHELSSGGLDHRPGPARRRGHLRRRASTRCSCGAGWGWSSRSRPRSRRCRSSTTSRRGCGSRPPADARRAGRETVERALRHAALWDEVKDRLQTSAIALSGGQQQRLCVARTIAPAPEVVLLDEPTASLDPLGTQRIEELVFTLKKEFTIVIVTHNMQQAARVSDTTTFFYLGEMIETGPTRQIFTSPAQRGNRSVHHRAVRMTATLGRTAMSNLTNLKPTLAPRAAARRYGRTPAAPGRRGPRASASPTASSEVLKGISLGVPRHAVTAIIGPSGCGKSTFLRAINRMHDLLPGASAPGRPAARRASIFDGGRDLVELRRRVGMVFQRPNPVPQVDLRQRGVRPGASTGWCRRGTCPSWSSAASARPRCGTR